MSMSVDWLTTIGKEVGDERLGIQVDNIKSGNDGDVCLSFITYSLLHNLEMPNCVDIGAEQGWWSIFCAKYARQAKIRSFEPNPLTLQAITQNIAGYPNIELHPCAISDKKGEISFTLAEGESHSRSSSDTKVQCDRLDSFLQENEVIDLMKIDTEGHELHILQSLESRFPIITTIVFEWSVYWYGNTTEECIENSLQMLRILEQHYEHMYILSRRGRPILYGPLSQENYLQFLQYYCENRLQTDIVVSKVPIQNIPTYPLLQIIPPSHPVDA